MGDLRAIDGGKAARAKRLASARVVRCPTCGEDAIADVWKGRVKDKHGKVIFKGTRIEWCVKCKRMVE